MTDEPPQSHLAHLIQLLPSFKRFTGERRREYNDQLLTPLYNTFNRVHDRYHELFVEIRHRLSAETGDPLTNCSDVFWRLQEDEAFQLMVAEAKAQFCRSRQADDALRGILRTDMQMSLMRIRWKEERRLLVLFCHYFLQHGPLVPTNEQLDQEAESVLLAGGDSYWDWSSPRIYAKLHELKDVIQIVRLLDAARNDHNQRSMNVRLAYQRIQTELGHSA